MGDTAASYGEAMNLASERVLGCDCRSRQHRASWRRWHKRAVGYQITIAALSALGGSAVLAGTGKGSAVAIVIGGATIAAAILTAATEAISPAKTAEAHQRAAIRFSALGVAFNTFVRTAQEDEAARLQFQALESAHLDAVREGPEPEEWTR